MSPTPAKNEVEMVDLPPGGHRVSETGEPDWTGEMIQSGDRILFAACGSCPYFGRPLIWTVLSLYFRAPLKITSIYKFLPGHIVL